MSRMLSRLRVTALSVTALAVLPASSAMAADAPLRWVNLGAQNEAGSPYSSALAIAEDGSKSIFGSIHSELNYLRIRDFVTATTTAPSADVSLDTQTISTDLGRVLHGRTGWLYVFDRSTGINTPVQRDLPNLSSSVALLSGDGRTVLLTTTVPPAGTYRVDVATGQSALVGTGTLIGKGVRRPQLDSAGNVALISNGIVVGSKLLPIPAGVATNSFVVSDNGATVAFFKGTGDARTIVTVDTAAGTVRTIALPLWVKRQTPQMFDLSTDGTKALLGVRQPRGADVRLTLGSFDLATGALAQVGGDLPYDAAGITTVTPNWEFAGIGNYVAQLGSKPIPGPDIKPVTPPASDFANYIGSTAGCRATQFPWISQKPTVYFPYNTAGTVTPKAELTVRIDATGVVVNQFTLGLNGSRSINAGPTGGYTISGTVTLADGQKVTGSRQIPVQKAETCVWFW